MCLYTLATGEFPFKTDKGYWGIVSSVTESPPPELPCVPLVLLRLTFAIPLDQRPGRLICSRFCPCFSSHTKQVVVLGAAARFCALLPTEGAGEAPHRQAAPGEPSRLNRL
jgi:hypothetical protein